jgi:hypothetical protein
MKRCRVALDELRHYRVSGELSDFTTCLDFLDEVEQRSASAGVRVSGVSIIRRRGSGARCSIRFEMRPLRESTAPTVEWVEQWVQECSSAATVMPTPTQESATA